MGQEGASICPNHRSQSAIPARLLCRSHSHWRTTTTLVDVVVIAIEHVALPRPRLPDNLLSYSDRFLQHTPAKMRLPQCVRTGADTAAQLSEREHISFNCLVAIPIGRSCGMPAQ